MTATKIFGFVLLSIGVVIIFYTLFASYNIFTGQRAVPEMFAVPEIAIEGSGKITGVEDLQDQMQQAMKEQMRDILPSDLIPNLLNLISWSILATILIFGGTHISNIGIKLIKD